MTVITDYESLKTRISEVLDRNDLADQVEAFIQMAEDEIASDIDHPRFRSSVTLAAGSQVGIPLDYKRMITMTQDGRGQVDYYAQSAYDDLVSTSQGGMIYTIVGDNFMFAPWLDNSSIRLVYKRRLDRLSYYNPSNWVLDNYPSAYLYAALKAASIYTIEDERIPMWETMYNQMIDRINRDGVEYATPSITGLVKRKVV